MFTFVSIELSNAQKHYKLVIKTNAYKTEAKKVWKKRTKKWKPNWYERGDGRQ